MKNYSKAQKNLEELQKNQPTPPPSASNTKEAQSQKIVVLPRDRLKKFGVSQRGSLTLSQERPRES